MFSLFWVVQPSALKELSRRSDSGGEKTPPSPKSDQELTENVSEARRQQSAGSLVMRAHVTGTLTFVGIL